MASNSISVRWSRIGFDFLIPEAKLALPVIALSCSVLVGWLLARGFTRLLIAACFFTLLATMILHKPRLGLVGTFAFLALQGDLRRIVTEITGPAEFDPLLLVGPASALLLLLQSTKQFPIKLETPLTKCMGGLTALMFLQAVNPLQGGVAIGLGGLLFYLPPLIWFWIGRAHGDENFVKPLLYKCIVPIGLAAFGLGLYQVTIGFLPYEQAWIDKFGYAALKVHGSTRPFSFFSAASEYMGFLAIALVATIAGRLRGQGTGVAAFPFLIGLFLASGRGVLVTSLVAIGVLWAVQGTVRSSWLPRLVLIAILGSAGTWWALHQLQAVQISGAAASLVEHQTDGLLNPLDPDNSTFLLHLSLLGDGVKQGLSNPLGYGTGITTRAATKLGGDTTNAEIDISNMFFSLGIVGGIMYLVTVIIIMRMAVLTWQRTRRVVPLAILGILVVGFGGWLIVGNYSTTALIWFLIGVLDRINQKELR